MAKYDHLIGSGFDRWASGSYTPGQLAAFYDYTHYRILMSGAYRSGKTEIGCRAAIRHAMFFPGAKVGVFRNFLASIRRSTLPTLLELIHPTWVAEWSNTTLEGRLLNGSTISFIGCDFADRLGSIELTFAFIDEASEISEESAGMIQGRLSGRLVKPANYSELPEKNKEFIDKTIDIRQVFLACNPKSKKHWLYQQFIKSPKPGHICYTSNSISNTNLPETYLVNNLSAYVRGNYDRNWVKEQISDIRTGLAPSDGLHLQTALTPFGQRNLLGLWVALEGAIYCQLDETYHYVDRVPDHWGELIDFVGGVDWGFHNPRVGVLAVYQVQTADGPQNHYAMVAGWNRGRVVPTEVINSMVDLTNKLDVSKWYLPPDQPGLIKQARLKLGTSVKKAKNAVAPGINTVSTLISSGRFAILRDNEEYSQWKEARAKAWGEMAGYEWATDKDDGYKDTPIKVDDHYPDLIRYILYSLHYRDKLLNLDPVDTSTEPKNEYEYERISL